MIEVLNQNYDEYKKSNSNTIKIDEIYLIKTEELRESEIKQPIIDYLLKHDIRLACWVCDGKPIDVWKECFDLEKNIISYDNHVYKVCDKNKCDLITYRNDDRIGPRKILRYERHNEYKFKITTLILI